MLGFVRASTVARAQSIADLRLLARQRLPRAVFDFFDGGAEDEQTLAENRAAFQRIKLVPRVLNNVSSVDLTATLLGAKSALPICVGPTGAAGFGGQSGGFGRVGVYGGGDADFGRVLEDAVVEKLLSEATIAEVECSYQDALAKARPAAAA